MNSIVPTLAFDPARFMVPLPTEVRKGELITSRIPPEVSVKMPKGIRKMPIRIKFIYGAMLGIGLKSIYDSRKNVAEAAVPVACVLQGLPAAQPGVLLAKPIL